MDKKQKFALAISKYFLLILIFLMIPLQLYVGYNENYIKDGYINLSINMDNEKCETVYSKDVCDKELEPGHYFFSEEDLEKIQTIPNIMSIYTNVYNMHTKNSDNSELSVNEITTLNLETADVVRTDTFFHSDGSYTFQSLKLPFDALAKTGKINETFASTIIYNNEYVDNQSGLEGIIIPSHIALEYDIHAGDLLILPVSILSSEGQRDVEKEYFVQGIYSEENLLSNEQRVIYVEYSDLSNYSDNKAQVYSKLEGIYGDIEEHKQYFQDESTFFDSYDNLYDEIHIFTDDVDTVYNQLVEMFPLQQIETSATYYQKVNENYSLIFMVIVMLVLIIIIAEILILRRCSKVKFPYDTFIEIVSLVVLIPIFEKLFLQYMYAYSLKIHWLLIILSLVAAVVVYIPILINREKEGNVE